LCGKNTVKERRSLGQSCNNGFQSVEKVQQIAKRAVGSADLIRRLSYLAVSKTANAIIDFSGIIRGRAYSTYIIAGYMQRVETRCYKMFEPTAL
jgi:hypothetical protein